MGIYNREYVARAIVNPIQIWREYVNVLAK
jgi:hypothetical protein